MSLNGLKQPQCCKQQAGRQQVRQQTLVNPVQGLDLRQVFFGGTVHLPLLQSLVCITCAQLGPGWQLRSMPMPGFKCSYMPEVKQRSEAVVFECTMVPSLP